MSRLLAALGHRPSLLPVQKASRVWPDVTAPYIGGSVPVSDTDFGALAKMYCEVIYVHVSISKRARALAFRPMLFYPADSDKEIKKHWLIDLFGTANPFECGYMIKQQIPSWLQLTGNAYLSYDNFPGASKDKGGSPSPLLRKGVNPREIYCLRPDRVQVVPDAKNYISEYQYTGPDGKLVYYKPEEVVHFRSFNPRNDFYGLSPLLPGETAIKTEKYAIGQTSKFFENSARPDYYIKTEQDLDDSGAEELIKRVESRFRSWWQSWRPTALGKGADIKAIPWNYKDMDFANLRAMSKRDITNLLGLPLPLIEMVDATFDNAGESRKEFWSDVQVLGREITDQLSESFLFVREGVRCAFDFSDVKPLQEDEDKISQIATRLTNGMNPVMSVNEAREKFYSMGPAPWGNTPNVPMGLPAGESVLSVPAKSDGEPNEKRMLALGSEYDAVKAMKEALDETYNQLHWFMLCKAWERQEEPFVQVLKRLFRAQEREVLGRIGQKSMVKAGESLDPDVVFDYDKWVATFYQEGRPSEAIAVSIGIEQAKRYLSDTMGAEAIISVENAHVQQYLADKTMKFARDVNRTTREKIRESVREELAEGLVGGETIDKIAGRVREVFDSASKARSLAIARTEIIGSSNQGTLMAYKASSIPLKKKWLPALDERTRDSHRRVGSLPAIPLNDPFIFQGEKGGQVRMNAPGDPNGPPEEVINCRCTIIPVQAGL